MSEILCKLSECNPDNLRLLKRYEMILRNKGRTEATIDGFCKGDIPLFLRYIKGKHLAEVTNMDVEDYIYYCQDERENGGEAINRKYTSLNSLYKHLIRKDYIDCKNPMDKIDKSEIIKNIREPLSREEILKIFDYIDNNNKLIAGALYSLFYSSGCRLTETWQLNKKSLNYNERYFIVMGKGKKARKCIFSEDARTRIEAYLKSRDDNLDALFVSRQHNKMSKSAIRNQIKNTARRAGIESNMFPHRIRHTAATHMRQAGAKIEDIQIFLGHADPGTTAAIYAVGNLIEIREQFDKILITRR